MAIIECVDMHCTEHGADKVYHLALEQVPGGLLSSGMYNVPFAYGRRGSSLNYGTKTTTPVDEDKARKIYQKQISAQFAKGYVSSPGVSGTVFGTATNAVSANGISAPKPVVGHIPQLLNVIDDDSTLQKYIVDPGWVMQEKFDGERRSIKRNMPLGFQGYNRKGQEVPLMPGLVVDVIKANRECLIDGEAVGEVLYAFDILELGELDLRGLPYINRYNALRKFVSDEEFSNIIVVETAFTAEQKRGLLTAVRYRKGEGVVLKRSNAPYSPGRPNSGGDQMKYKFWESGTFIVQAHNSSRSVSLLATSVDPNGTARFHPVGNVTIPPNHNIPNTGAYVEIRYLYYYPGGSLFQPIYLGERKDVLGIDCHISKLKVKQFVP